MPVFVTELPRGAVPRPWGVPGPHLRRSNVARYRDDVSVCETVDDARAAVRSGRTLLKAEYSSSGLGALVADALDDGGAALRWLANQLRRDGRVTAEPLYDVVAEFTGEWDCGTWVGVSQCAVDHMRWTGQHLGDPKDRYSAEVYAFVFETHAIEAFLEPLDVPGTCGSATCGADVAVVRGAAGLEVRLLEVNARTTMSHFALAAKRRVPAAAKFDVVRAADLRPDLLPLTDAAGATFVAVVELPS